MNNLIFSAIAGIASFVRVLRLKQALIAVLAGFFLLTSTACGANTNTASARSYDAAPSTYGANEQPSRSSSPYDKGTGPQRELYKPKEPAKGGMNIYPNDPAYNREDVKADAKQLIDRAENRLQKRAANPQEAIENAREYNPLGEGVRKASQRIGDSAEQAKENITEGSQKGLRNLKGNVEKARQEAPDVVDTARQNADNATRGVREGARDLSQGAQRAADRAASAAKDRA
jgi:hypothetical protein